MRTSSENITFTVAEPGNSIAGGRRHIEKITADAGPPAAARESHVVVGSRG